MTSKQTPDQEYQGTERSYKYTKADMVRAQKAMLRSLAEISGGVLIAACCSQGCCDDLAQEFVIDLEVKRRTLYNTTDLEIARRAMLRELIDIGGGALIAGCADQGCMDREAQDFVFDLSVDPEIYE